ncbi:uncharacterized protein FFB20_06092 [Fusarium fujikuroi]|nr:uncharacterized protein FFE2_01007 [Fusarium fujikuroi]SCN70736.1 uncharacterized protein FFC1_01005 [Fusarium fujikuroi]SCN74641.1 uncharacterized protein FFM5_00965 [Fusarium fujikuroi]SCN80268.1 uncharacterized protein FFB20_06092 [Fusarium fujikuroi]SCO29007.1 uncharacterized protein FFMR_01222 [Fusarium fujikuroi]
MSLAMPCLVCSVFPSQWLVDAPAHLLL